MQRKTRAILASVAFMPVVALAQVGRGGNVLNDDGGSGGGGGDMFGPWLIPVVIGAAGGYFIERAYNKAKLDKEGIKYSSEYLGGKTGAIIGAIGLPLLIGLLR